jgi:hypothetical protein
MRFIDRFTLDDVSAKVWWPFAMVLLVLFVLTFPRNTEPSPRGTATPRPSMPTSANG